MHALAEPPLADLREILERVGREPARLDIRSRQHDLDDLGLLLAAERRRPAAVPAVGEAVDAVRFVAQHPVAQRLAIASALDGMSREDAARDPRVIRLLRKFAQYRRRAVLPDLKRGHEAPSRIDTKEGITNRHRRGIAIEQHESIKSLAGVRWRLPAAPSQTEPLQVSF